MAASGAVLDFVSTRPESSVPSKLLGLCLDIRTNLGDDVDLDVSQFHEDYPSPDNGDTLPTVRLNRIIDLECLFGLGEPAAIVVYIWQRGIYEAECSR